MHFEWPRMRVFWYLKRGICGLILFDCILKRNRSISRRKFLHSKIPLLSQKKNIIIEQHKGRKPFGVFLRQGNTFYNQKEFYSNFSSILLPINNFSRKSRTSQFKTNDCVCDKKENVIIARLINEMTLI